MKQVIRSFSGNRFLEYSVISGFLFLLLSAAAQNISAQQRVPEPAKNRMVIRAKEKYDVATDGVKEAKMQLSRERVAMNKLIRGGSIQSFKGGKSQQLMEAESTLAELQRELGELKEKLLEEGASEVIFDQRARITAFKDDIAEARAKSVPGEMNTDLIELTRRLNSTESLLRSHEDKLLSQNTKYVRLREKMTEAKRKVLSIRQMEAQDAASSKGFDNSAEVEQQKLTVNSAIETYANARKRQDEARKALAVAIEKATANYKAYLVKQEEQRKRNLQRRGRRSQAGRAIRRANNSRRYY